MRLAAMSEAALEVVPTEFLRSIASSLLAQHDLRSADALQLAAALVLKLGIAAQAVGFAVLPAP
jgi:hypothetical protein